MLFTVGGLPAIRAQPPLILSSTLHPRRWPKLRSPVPQPIGMHITRYSPASLNWGWR